MVAINNLCQARMSLAQQQYGFTNINYIEQQNASSSIFGIQKEITIGMLDGSCTDGKDDGKIGLKEGAKSLLKGAVKSIIPSSPKGWLKAIGTGIACAALVAVTGGAATPFLIAGGAAIGAVQTGKGIYQASKATTDAEAKAAFENIGGGVTTMATSVVAAKSYAKPLIGKGSLATYKNAGAESIANIKTNFGNLTNSIKTNGSNFVNSVKNDMNIELSKQTEIDPFAIEQKNSFFTQDGIEIIEKDNFSAAFGEVDKMATFKARVQGIGLDSKELFTSLAADGKMGATQMVNELVARGISKSEAIALVSASNSKYNMQQEDLQNQFVQYYM